MNKIVLAFITVLPTLAMANTTSLDYALAGKNAVVAVNCITSLDKGFTKDEFRRNELFKIFERDSDLFLKGVNEHKITNVDIDKNVPTVWEEAIKDAKDSSFVKGYVFGRLRQYAFDYADNIETPPKTYFEAQYKKDNCDLIK